MIKKNKRISTQSDYYAKEWLKCREYPLYFILVYCFIPETGGKIKLTKELLHPKLRRTIRCLHKLHKAVLMATRQLGKSTIAALMIVWACIFFPRNRAVILNMKKSAALNNISTIKFIIEHLPDWMVTSKPFKSRSDIQSYVTLFNGSKIEAFYPSTVHNSATLARSLTVPILYIDEAAFIPHMKAIFGSAQQTLSKARMQAKKNNYPFFILITSTPNGSYGTGEWFYNRWGNAVDTDFLFNYNIESDKEEWIDNDKIIELIKNPAKNSFPRIYFHWREDPTKDDEWYLEQKQELDDVRLCNQELDLLFVGSTNCIFDDETISAFESKKPVLRLPCLHGATLDVFEENLDTKDFYLIGCDTAESLNGAFCAIQIFSFRDFNQIAELQFKFGSYTHFGQVINFVFQWLYKQVGERIILCVENNSIGKAPIEYLLNYVEDFEYDSYIHKEATKKEPTMKQFGVKTTASSKPLFVGCLLELINENIKGFRSHNLIAQFSSIEKTQSGSIKSSSYSDLFMASTFCAYVRKRRSLEILPQIEFTTKEIETKFEKEVTDLLDVTSIKRSIKNPPKFTEGEFDISDVIGLNEDIINYREDDYEISSLF